MQEPLVSIVMPAYNAEKYIAEAINCILSQSYRNFELIIADDCSTDSTKNVISKIQDERIRFYSNEINQGYLKTCNNLFALCKGTLVTFQDADDISNTDRIEKQVNAFVNDTDVDICTTNSFIMDSSGKIIMARKWPVDYQRYRSDPNYNAIICGATIMLKNDLLKKAGFYHEYFNRIGGEDMEWFFRCVCMSIKGIHINEELYSYRVHDSAIRIANKGPVYLQSIIDEIRIHFIKTGEYLLDEKHAPSLRLLEKKYENEFLKDPSKLIRIKANGAIAAKEYVNFLKLSWVTFKTEPTNPKNYTAFFGSIYNRFKGIIYNLLNQTK